ncbi:hypothetical protein [Halovenus sp. HT40]
MEPPQDAKRELIGETLRKFVDGLEKPERQATSVERCKRKIIRHPL